MKIIIRNSYRFMILFCLFSCDKYLDTKPDQRLVLPRQLSDLQALLDNTSRMNTGSPQAEASADNYYLTDIEFNALARDGFRNTYTWQDQQFSGMPNSATDWARLYGIVYYANVVLDEIPQLEDGTTAEKQGLKAAALFYRGKAFFEILNNWAVAYRSSTAGTDMGIPLRLSSDFNEPTTRSTMEASARQIILDLETALQEGLPFNSSYRSRPSKVAGYAMLARVYLYFARYEKAELYADSALTYRSELMAYDKLNAGANFPFPSGYSETNPEIIYYSNSSIGATLAQARGKIDSVLIRSYSSNDLRATIFYKKNTNGTYAYKGNYSGTEGIFTGLATDELYLVKAECLARRKQAAEALTVLNQLLVKRWKPGTFTAFQSGNWEQVLQWVLEERRKELVYRNQRWLDLKRLNAAGANIVINRKLNNTLLTLLPNDPRYALAIPEDVIEITGIPQNPR